MAEYVRSALTFPANLAVTSPNVPSPTCDISWPPIGRKVDEARYTDVNYKGKDIGRDRNFERI